MHGRSTQQEREQHSRGGAILLHHQNPRVRLSQPVIVVASVQRHLSRKPPPSTFSSRVVMGLRPTEGDENASVRQLLFTNRYPFLFVIPSEAEESAVH